MLGKVKLEVLEGPMDGKVFEFEEHDIFLLGRASDCHIRLQKDPGISRRQFIIEVNPPSARIRDLGSLNGTHVNGTKHGGRRKGETPAEGAKLRHPDVEIRHGDQIRVGKTLITVGIEAPPAGSQRLRCSNCMNDAAPEVGDVRMGEYVCDACRKSGEADPLALLGARPRAARGSGRAGSPIHGYEIERKIGAGGFGAVYLARRKQDGRSVAMKVMLSRVAVDEASRAMFLREIETLKQLRHKNIVTLLDHGAAGAGFFFVMDFCTGGTVQDLMIRRGGKLSVAEAGPLMLQALEGLAFAHEKGFVHRDLKPPNILLDGDERRPTVRVSDFGLAKCFERAGFSGNTLTGQFVGTPPFMPPEQVTNYKRVKPASDVWSLAATFYAMLTGRLPLAFPKGIDPVEVVLDCEVRPLRSADPAVPAAVAAVIDRALSKNIRDRYEDAGQFGRALMKAI
ncbi:MAG: protein kinase [Planctomycetia bacterium]|nr:protein kinase [Planctomycetia bacterium]